MDIGAINLLCDWDDPQLDDKAKRFFLAVYNARREEQIAGNATTAEVPAPAHADAGTTLHLGLDSLPEEYLPSELFLKLLQTRKDILALFATPMEEIDDGSLAAYELMRRVILNAAYGFVDALLFYLLADKRFHPERPMRIDASRVLGLGDSAASQEVNYTRLNSLLGGLALCNRVWQPVKPNALFVKQLDVLRESGNIFFCTLQSIFPLCAIGKCHMAFSMFMQNLGTCYDERLVANYVRRRKTMMREILEWQAHGGSVARDRPRRALDGQAAQISALTERVDALRADVGAQGRTIANMDRRQKTLHGLIRKTLDRFVGLFAPRAGRPAPARETVAAQLTPPDRYACLARTTEPHRSQIKAVIDYTYKHPIVLKQRNRNEFSLSNAARAVWNENHWQWESCPGHFENFAQLKSACYSLQNRPDDPFHYAP